MLCGWAVLGANPFVIGSWNLHHHARFYDEYPRTYRLWLVVNPVELAIALGLPAVVWCRRGLFAPRGVPLSVWSTLVVLTLTNLTGRNMGEVARLWMLYMPPLLVGAGYGFERWAQKTRPAGCVDRTARPANARAAINDPGRLSGLGARTDRRVLACRDSYS